VPSDNPFAGPTPGADEIWSTGLRNPWRFSFDRLTGDLTIGDVGQRTWEEVDYVGGPNPGRGVNFGWNCMEGTHAFRWVDPPCNEAQDFTNPVFEYEHEPWPGNCSVTGGYVVRDTGLGDLYGRYLFADFCTGELRSLDLGPPVDVRSENLTVSVPTSFGEDSACRIYVASLNGPVYRLAEPSSSGGGCTRAATAPPPAQPAPPDPPPPPSEPAAAAAPQSSAHCRGREATVEGLPGPETVRGSQGPDIIAAGGGADRVRGLGGDDLICGGRGRDTLRGGPGDDRLRAGTAADRLFGGTGPDVCDGGGARDTAAGCSVERRL
jgi:hypothetical protein